MPPRRQNRNQREEQSVNNEGGQADPMQNFADMIAQAMENRAPTGRGRLRNQPADRLANFKVFKAVGSPEFKGTTDPIEAQTWVKEMEKAFIIARVTEEQKTAFATYLMKGEANYWWETNQARAGTEVVLWTRFKELFFENYFSPSMQSRMEVKFLELKQKNMSVSEYAAKFNELARFAPHQVDTEARKARRFENELKPGIYNKVAVLQINTFAALMEKALIAEGGSEAAS